MDVDEIKRRRRAAAVQALHVIGDDLLGRAIRDAPIDEGTLRGSGSVDVDERANSASVEVTFSTPYAARQHEEVTWDHPRGGKAKYLEDNLKAMSQRYVRALADAMRKVT